MSTKTITLGCRLNAYESERMSEKAERFLSDDAIIINTCAVTQKAVRDSRRAVRRAAKDANGRKVIVTGCASQIEPTLFSGIDGVDAVLGNGDKLREDVWQSLPSGRSPRPSDVMQVQDLPSAPPTRKAASARAMLQIQNGCDHRCTFCVIPFGRGNARSLPVNAVIEAVQRFVDFGHCEVVLTGVDLTSWGQDLDNKPQLGHLLVEILERVPDLPQLRLSSIDAIEIDPVFKSVLSEPRLAPYLHLSLQHGDSLILKRMKRRHSPEQVVELCAELKDIRPDIAFGADLIAGFPTETEMQFQNAINIIDACGLAFVHVFPFSPRPGTPAAKMPQNTPQCIKERTQRLLAQADIARSKHLQNHVATSRRVLIETPQKGRLADFTPVQFTTTFPGVDSGFVEAYITYHDGSVLMAQTQ